MYWHSGTEWFGNCFCLRVENVCAKGSTVNLLSHPYRVGGFLTHRSECAQECELRCFATHGRSNPRAHTSPSLFCEVCTVYSFCVFFSCLLLQHLHWFWCTVIVTELVFPSKVYTLNTQKHKNCVRFQTLLSFFKVRNVAIQYPNPFFARPQR